MEEERVVHPPGERGVRGPDGGFLDLYHEAYDPERPVVCFDETSRQLVEDVRPPIKAKPGRVERYDTEYQRNGTRNRFMFCEPKGGWRHVEVTERRTAVDFAHQMRWLVDQAYPHARDVRLVLDNLNTHKLGSLYEAFGASEARRIAKRLEFHHTPTHGSWLSGSCSSAGPAYPWTTSSATSASPAPPAPRSVGAGTASTAGWPAATPWW